jgi:hypothetical protein
MTPDELLNEVAFSFPCNTRLTKLIQKAKETSSFMSWFGNSKVVDCNGDPLPVYHGTVKDFDMFALAQANSSGTAISTNYLGFYFTTEPETADVYSAKSFDVKKGSKVGGNTKIVFLRVRNPKVITEKAYWILSRKDSDGIAQYLEKAKRQGYDAFFMPTVWRGKKGGIDIVVFEPEQIQSVFASINQDSLEEEYHLEEANAVGGGGVAGFNAPLGMDTTGMHTLLWKGTKKEKDVKTASPLSVIHEGVEFAEAPIVEPKRKTPTDTGTLGIVQDGGVENILKVFNEATPEEKEYWGKWYHNAKVEVQDLAVKYSLPFQVAAAAVAVLSPGSKWRVNMLAAERLLENMVHPEKAPRPVPGYPRQVARAKDIILTGDVGKVTGPKVTVFFKSLLDPTAVEKELVLDGHAINIWRGKKQNLNSLAGPNKEQRAKMLADYQTAANQLGVPVQAVQAVTWYIWKYTNDKPVVKPKTFDVSAFLAKVPENDNALDLVNSSDNGVSLEALIYEDPKSLMKALGHEYAGNNYRLGSETYVQGDDPNKARTKSIVKAVNKNINKKDHFRDPPAVGISLPDKMKG